MSDSTTRKPEAPVTSIAKHRRLRDCKTLAEAFETGEFADMIEKTKPSHMVTSTMLRAFVMAANKAPNIYKCDIRQSVGSMLSLSYLGLVPGTIQQHAHLIPFAKTKWNPKTRTREPAGYDLQVIIGYQGYVELAFRSGIVRDLASGLVFPGDHFDYERGSKRFLSHKPNIDIDNTNSLPRAAYAIATFTNEGEEFEIMSLAEIERIRNRSQAYRTALAAKEQAQQNGRSIPPTWTEAPWVLHFGQMARKTAIRRLAGTLPKSPELMGGLGIEDANDAGKLLDFGPVIDGTATPMDGLPEQQDEPTPDAVDPGAAHTDRREEEQPPAKTEAAKPTPKPPEFSQFIVDEVGEVGPEFSHPEAFALEYVALLKATTSDAQRETLQENNEAALADIVEFFPHANAILQEAWNPSLATSPTAVVQPIEGRGGRKEWRGYPKAIGEALERISHGPALLSWLEAQRPVLAEAPPAQRMLALKAAFARLTALNTIPPSWVPEMMAGRQQAPQPRDEAKLDQMAAAQDAPTDEQIARSVIADLENVTERSHVVTLAAQRKAWMAGVKTRDVALWEAVDQAFADALDRVHDDTPGAA